MDKKYTSYTSGAALDDDELDQVSGGAFEPVYSEEEYRKASEQKYVCPHCSYFDTAWPYSPVNGPHCAGYQLSCRNCGNLFIGYADGSTEKC